MPDPQPSTLAQLDAEVARFHSLGGQPGLAYGVVASGRLVTSGGFGERRCGRGQAPDADTVFRIASMTKSFTAALVLLLRDRGALGLDDPVHRHVPELAGVSGPTADSPPPTIRSLLTMTAGLPTDDPWGDRQQALPAEEFSELLRGGLSFAWAPGSAFEYSNLGYAVLGRVIEAAGGGPYRRQLTDRLLAPLGLRSAAFESSEVDPRRLATGHTLVDGGWQEVPADGYGAFAPMGGLFGSVRDLARWVAGFTDAFPPRDDPPGLHPLQRASRREMQQPHRTIAAELVWPQLDAVPRARATAYGFGLVCELDRRHGTIVSHSGGYPGFGSHMRWHPHSGLGVVVLANSTYAGAHRVATSALALLLDAAGGPHRRRYAGTAGPAAPRGEQAWAQTLAARADVDGLLARWDEQVAARLFAPNVELDDPLPRRRAQVERIRASLGALRPDLTRPAEHASPAHCRWWLVGERGRLRAEILLTPQHPPLVQTLTLVALPDTPPAVQAVVEQVVAALAAPLPHWPEGVATGADLDRSALTRLLRLGAEWAGACELAEPTGGDGAGEAGYRLRGQRAALALALAVRSPLDPTVTRFTLALDP